MRFFTFREFKVSAEHPRAAKALVLTPDLKDVITLGVESILDPLREDIGKSIIVVSGYRDENLNRLVGGSWSSDHCTANAADITSSVGAKKLFVRAKKLRLPYRQLIWYPADNFVHVSWNIPGKTYKHEAWRNDLILERG